MQSIASEKASSRFVDAGKQRLVPHTARCPHIQQASRCTRANVIMAAQKLDELPANLKKIVGAFQMVPDPMARYKQLLFFATKLEKLPEDLQLPEYKVEGCVSQVWLVPELRADGKMYFRADSDSQLTKGLAALLVNGLSGCTPSEILTLQTEFIEMLGLKQSLTPSRNNGFLNMVKLMQRKTLELAKAAEAGTSNGHSNGHSNGSNGVAHAAPAAAQPVTPSASNTPAAAAPSNSNTPIQDSMRRKLSEAFNPIRFVIEDQSAQHAGHAAMTALPGRGSASGETHFRVQLVSDAFTGKTLVQRQRLVYALLQDEFAAGLHALSLDTKSPSEVSTQQ